MQGFIHTVKNTSQSADDSELLHLRSSETSSMSYTSYRYRRDVPNLPSLVDIFLIRAMHFFKANFSDLLRRDQRQNTPIHHHNHNAYSSIPPSWSNVPPSPIPSHLPLPQVRVCCWHTGTLCVLWCFRRCRRTTLTSRSRPCGSSLLWDSRPVDTHKTLFHTCTYRITKCINKNWAHKMIVTMVTATRFDWASPGQGV